MDMKACIHTAAEAICSNSSLQPQVGLILGSSLGDFCDGLQNAVKSCFLNYLCFHKPLLKDIAVNFGSGRIRRSPFWPCGGACIITRGIPRMFLPSLLV